MFHYNAAIALLVTAFFVQHESVEDIWSGVDVLARTSCIAAASAMPTESHIFATFGGKDAVEVPGRLQ